MKQQTHKTQEQLKYDTHAILHLNKHHRGSIWQWMT